MSVKTYYRDGRTDAFDTANLTDASMYRGNVATNWSLNLSDAIRDGGMLLLSMHWYPAPEQDAPAGPEGLPIARRRDGLCVVVADSVVVKQKPWPAKTGRGFCLAAETIFLRRPTRLRAGLQLGRFARLLHHRLALQVFCLRPGWVSSSQCRATP